MAHSCSGQSRHHDVQSETAARVLSKCVCWCQPICTLASGFLLLGPCCSCVSLPLRGVLVSAHFYSTQSFLLVNFGHGSLPNTFSPHTIRGFSACPGTVHKCRPGAAQGSSAPSSMLRAPLPSPVRPESQPQGSLPSNFVPSLAVLIQLWDFFRVFFIFYIWSLITGNNPLY